MSAQLSDRHVGGDSEVFRAVADVTPPPVSVRITGDIIVTGGNALS